jgi:hypothetical protein
MAKTRKGKVVGNSLEKRYLELLAEEGYRPQPDEDGDDESFNTISFKAEGKTFLLFAYEDDPDYFNVGFSFDLGETSHDPAALAALALDVNERVKGVKCSIAPQDNAVRFQVETFLGGATASPALLRRSIDALQHAARTFFEKRVPPDHLDA